MKIILFILLVFTLKAEEIKFNTSTLPLFSGMTENTEDKLEKKEEIDIKTKPKKILKKENTENDLKLFSDSNEKMYKDKNMNKNISILDKIEEKTTKIEKKSFMSKGKTIGELNKKEKKTKVKVKKNKQNIEHEKFEHKIIYDNKKNKQIINSLKIYYTEKQNYYIPIDYLLSNYLDVIYGVKTNL